MPNIVGPDCVDTPSTDGNCLYPAEPLGGEPFRSPNVKMEGENVEIYSSLNFPEPVEGQKINPLITIPCQPGARRIQPTLNTTVYINGVLFAVQGDEAQLVIGSTPRPLVGPFKYPTVRIVEGGSSESSEGGESTPPETPDEEFPPDDGGSFELY